MSRVKVLSKLLQNHTKAHPSQRIKKKIQRKPRDEEKINEKRNLGNGKKSEKNKEELSRVHKTSAL